MHATRQYIALLGMNLAGIGARLGPVLTIIIGVTCAVGVLVSMLAMGAGAHRQAMGDVREDRIVILSTGAQSVFQSSIPKDTASVIRNLPGIRQDASSQPVAVSVALILMEARKKLGDARTNFPLLGVSPGLADLRPELHLTAGRMFRPGLHELIVSESCARQFGSFEIGDNRSIRGSDWAVVGHFTQGNAQAQCTVYADAETVTSAFGVSSYNEVTVMLQSAAGYDDFLGALQAIPNFTSKPSTNVMP